MTSFYSVKEPFISLRTVHRPLAQLVAILVFLLGSGSGRAVTLLPERIHYPQQVGGFTGWNVTPDKGELGVVIPAMTVPGDIPIPVVFRFNATFAQQKQPIWKLTTNIKTGLDSWASTPGFLDRAIEGSIHFGMILPAPGWAPDALGGAASTSRMWAWSWVLENGAQYSVSDFTAQTVLSPSLLSAFQLGAKTANVNVDSTGTVAFYAATSADLGHWAAMVNTLTSGANFSGALLLGPTGYQVVMDRDKARIFAFDYDVNGWVPVLWVDRFSHYVTFQWTRGGSVSAPFGNHRVLTVLNSRASGTTTGLQLQTVTASVQSSEPLLRVDYIGIQAPSLQVTGFSGLSSKQPAALGGAASSVQLIQACDHVIRPTEVRLGQPGTSTLPTPAWSSTLPSQPNSEPWLPDRTWTFDYLDTQCSELNDLTDPLGVKTTFTWNTNQLYSVLDGGPNLYRSVGTATSSDARTGIIRTRTFTQNLPSTASGTWTTTQTSTYSPCTYILAAATSPNLITRTYAPPTDQNYNNGALSNVVVTNGGTTLSSTSYSLPEQNMYGQDGTLSYVGPFSSTFRSCYGLSRLSSITGPFRSGSGSSQQCSTQTTTFQAGDRPNVTVSSVLDPQVAGRINSTTTSSSAGTQEVVAYTYDPGGSISILDPNRVIQIDYKRIAGTAMVAPSQVTTFDPTYFYPTSSCNTDASGNKMGQNMTYDPSTGHLTTVQDFAAGSFFNTAMGAVTRQWTVDSNTGLRTALAVSYYDPDSGFTDSYSQSWPLSSYDSADRATSSTDGLGVSTTTSYYADGRVWQVSRAGSGTITYAYPNEYTVSVTQNGLTTTTTIDGFGHVISRLRGSDGVTENYFLDTNGMPVKSTLVAASGATRTTLRGFDAQGRLVSLTPPVGGTSMSYAYSLSAASSTIGDQVITTTYNNTQPFSTKQILDQWGQAVSSTDPMGNVTTATYDAMGHVTGTVVTPPGGTGQSRVFTFNTLGLLTSKQEPETGTIAFGPTFDIHGLPSTITENGGRVRNLKFDGLGRLRDQSGGNITEIFRYNGLFLNGTNRVVGNDSVNQTFTYNGPGARMDQETTSGAVTGAW